MSDKEHITTDLVTLRDVEKRDRSFIISTWLKGLRFGNEWFKLIDQDTYFKVYHDVIDNILNQKKTKIKVACLKDDSEVILGYCVFNDNVIHWMFVKQAWRSIGIGNLLIPKDIKTVTHVTKIGKAIVNKKGLIFNPFILN